MGNLIRTQFYRYRRSGLFWTAVVSSLMFGYLGGQETAQTYDYFGYLHGRFNDLVFLPLFLILAVFLSAAIGREYSDGTMRNQIIAGTTRTCIFWSQLLCSVLVSLLFSGLFLAAFLYHTTVNPLSYLSLGKKLLALVIFLCVNGTFAVLFTVGSLTISSRELGFLCNLLIVGCLVITAGSTISRLNQLETIPDPYPKQVEMTPQEVAALKEGTFKGSAVGEGGDDGVMTYYKYVYDTDRSTPNPRYLGGARRKAAKLWIAVDPYGQICETVTHLNNSVYNDDPAGLPIPRQLIFFPAFSLGLGALAALSGVLIFRKKELR